MKEVYTDASHKILCFKVLQENGKWRTRLQAHFYKTTNEAEYAAVVMALQYLKGDLDIRVDSQLVANQFNGTYSVRSESMRRMLQMVKDNIGNRKVTINWVPRELNFAGIAIEKEEARG